MGKHLVLISTFCAVAGLFLIPLHPVHSSFTKLAFVACALGAWVGGTLLVWKKKPLRMLALSLPILGSLLIVLPSREIDAEELRPIYLRRLAAQEGTPYHWGGESSRGIDCSGLPRRALRDALLVYGVSHFNARAVREYAAQWWFDASARALGEGYRNVTRSLGTSGTIREMEYDTLVEGDLAVTANGVHVLVYMGNGQWIQADPGTGKVDIFDGRTSDNLWLRTPVTTHRWQVLTQPSSTR